MTAEELYSQCADKQRIVITGGSSKLIASLIKHVYEFNQRKADLAVNGSQPQISADSSVIIIENVTNLKSYQHHILVFGNTIDEGKLSEIEQLADATPKAGLIIYPKNHSGLNKICSKERPDVQALSYEVYKHEKVEGKTVLISSTKERFPIELNGDVELLCISAAKEVLKKTGISSSQFYKAISTYQSA